MASTAYGRPASGNSFARHRFVRSSSFIGGDMRLNSLDRTDLASQRRRWGFLGLATLLSATLILGACADDEDDPEAVDIGDGTATVATEVTETPAATGTEPATGTATETTTETATPELTTTAAETIEREGVSFVSPTGWVGSADTWTSPDGNVTLLFATVEREAGVEPEAAVLPEGAVNLDREEVETSIGTGAIHTVELTTEEVFERHAIITTDDRIYDWWLAAETVEELDEHQETLEEVLDSVIAVEEDE